MITAQILTCFGQKMQNSLFELFLIYLRFSDRNKSVKNLSRDREKINEILKFISYELFDDLPVYIELYFWRGE